MPLIKAGVIGSMVIVKTAVMGEVQTTTGEDITREERQEMRPVAEEAEAVHGVDRATTIREVECIIREVVVDISLTKEVVGTRGEITAEVVETSEEVAGMKEAEEAGEAEAETTREAVEGAGWEVAHHKVWTLRPS